MIWQTYHIGFLIWYHYITELYQKPLKDRHTWVGCWWVGDGQAVLTGNLWDLPWILLYFAPPPPPLPPPPLILSVRHSLNYRFFGRYVLLHQGIVFRSTVLNRLCSFLPWVPPPLPTPTGAPPLPRQNFKVATLRGYTVISFMTNRHTMCFIRCF